MTRVEAIDYLDNYRKMYADLAPEKFLEALDILLSEYELPKNMDEAMDKNFETMEVLEHENIFEETHHNIFKAGAEWLAEQGTSFDTKVGWIDGPTILDWPDDILDKFEMGDEVIVQIRKKEE